MNRSTSTPDRDGPPDKRFGAFGGVFTPSILTILGVVMYLRFGWVTGQVGLGGALAIVGLSHLISLATGLSVASIATNRTVGTGGAYFMISRSLGVAAGGAIGIPLFFAQALSVTFYIVGFTEAVMQLVPDAFVHELPLISDRRSLAVAISSAVNVVITVVSLKSAGLAIKAQYVVMGAILLSLVAFFSGHTPEFPREIEWLNAEGESFATVFAVFFPAVTGIMAGVSMSGDLKDPRRALPRGTLWAIFAGLVVYLAFPVWLALNASNASLTGNLHIVWDIARFPSLIYVGVWGATLSSALGSVLSAPRTLQALAFDGLVPRAFGRSFGKGREPRVGIAATFLLAQAGIALGSLDVIAPVLTMFFLVTYGMTNLACGLERWAASPSFRPTFRVPALLSMLSGLACFYVMSIIDLPAMLVALSVAALIFVVAERRALGTTFGDARHGIWAALVRSALYRLRRVRWHPLNWRPNLVILGGNPQRRPHLLQLGSAIVQDRGIVTYFHLVEGSVEDNADLRRELFKTYEEEIAVRFPHVFYRVDVVESIYRGTVQVAQTYGIGNFEANAVMVGWPSKVDRADSYVQMLRELLALDRSLLLVRHQEERGLGERRHIQVWWGGLEGNGGLMLLLAFLITADYRWRNATVSIVTVVNAEEDRRAAEASIERLLSDARVGARPRVLVRANREIAEIMREEARDADLTMLGFKLPGPGQPVEPFFERMSAMLKELPTTVLVHSAPSFVGEPVLFDEDGSDQPSPPG